MAIIYSIQNQKGGVGKSETAGNLAVGVSAAGYKTLLIINDPQANVQDVILKEKNDITAEAAIQVREAFDKMVKEPDELKGYKALLQFTSQRTYPVDISEVLENPIRITEAIYDTEYPNLDILPASSKLSMTDTVIKASGKNPAGRLRMALSYIDDRYDVIIIDNSPFENSLTYNSMCACYRDTDTIIIPVNISKRSMDGLSKTLTTLIEWLSTEPLRYDFKILITMKQRNKINEEWINTLRHIFPDRVFKQEIRYQSKPIEKSALQKKILIEDNFKSNVQDDYKSFIQEILEDIKSKLK